MRKRGDTVSIDVPLKPLHPDDTIVVVEIEGTPDVEPPLVAQEGDAAIELDYITAVTSGETVKRFNRAGEFHISKWKAPEDAAAWRVRINKPGRYQVEIEYAARKEWAGGEYAVLLDSQSATATVEDTGDWYEYREFDIGAFDVAEAGEHTLTIRPETASDHYLMYFKSLRLAPAR